MLRDQHYCRMNDNTIKIVNDKSLIPFEHLQDTDINDKPNVVRIWNRDHRIENYTCKTVFYFNKHGMLHRKNINKPAHYSKRYVINDSSAIMVKTESSYAYEGFVTNIISSETLLDSAELRRFFKQYEITENKTSLLLSNSKHNNKNIKSFCLLKLNLIDINSIRSENGWQTI